MTTTMAEQHSTGGGASSDAPTPEQTRRGRRVALLLFAVGFGPLILATVMYYTGWLNPEGISSNGVLVEPAVAVSSLALTEAGGQPFADRFGPDVEAPTWMMVVAAGDCQQDCEQLIYLARQVNVALGKNQERMRRAAYLQTPPADLSGYPDMPLLGSEAASPENWPGGVNIKQTPQLYVIDPFGNVMLRYGSEYEGKAILKDLKHLMKLSQIG
ncbi:hypothetical protein ACTXGQ_14710 [Marinobacter sp. 1Y8]